MLTKKKNFEKFFSDQLKILKFIKKKKIYSYNNNLYFYNNNHFPLWHTTLGSKKIFDKFTKISWIYSFNLKLKSIFSIYVLNYYKIELNLPKNYSKKKFKHLIFTNFSHNKLSANYYDPYFNVKVLKRKNILWILLNLSSNKIEKKFENIVFINSNLKKKKNIFFYINFIFYFLQNIFNEDIFEKKLFESIEICVNNLKFLNGSVYVPYEGQPVHDFFFSKIKDKFPRVKNIGYLHTGPSAVPTEIFENKLIDKMIVHGSHTKKVLIKFCNWNKKKIIISRSFRFINSKFFSSGIYLPYNFKNKNFIINKIIELKKIKNLNLENIFIHPHKKNDKKHVKIKNELQSLLRNDKAIKNHIIFINNSSGIFYALECGLVVIHISENPISDILNPKIWKNIKINKICDNVYIYKLKIKNSLIKFGKKNEFVKFLK